MERIERKEYSVLVAVSNPASIPSLMEAAVAIARHHQGQIIVVSVVEVAEGESLMRGRRHARAVEPLLDQAIACAARRGMTARGVLKIAHRVSEGILDTVREEDCNFLLVGRPVADSLLERLFASIVERVLQSVPNQVGVVYGTIASDRIPGVVVPITSGASSQLAAELTPGFSACYGARARAVTVIPTDTPDDEAEEMAREARETLARAGTDVPLEVLRRPDVGTGLVESLGEGDLVVIGAPTTDPVAALLAETLPRTIARRGRGPMIVVRDVEAHHPGRFERFFLGGK